VDIETTFDSTYDMYEIIVSKATVVDAAFNPVYVRLKLGGSYDTGSNYKGCNMVATTTTINTANDAGLSYLRVVSAGLGNGTTDHFDLIMHIDAPDDTAFCKQVFWDGVANTAGVPTRLWGAGSNTAITALTGVRFYASSGNILAGTFRLYGIKNS